MRPSGVLRAGLAVALLFILKSAPGRADVSEQVPVGPRGIAMGGAFSSLADDATALFWNPAGLPWIGHQEITGTHANLFGTGIKDNYLAFVLPLSPSQAVAVDWYHSGFTDSELDFGENRIDLSYGWRYKSLLSLGATAKYLTRDTGLDGSTVRRGNGTGIDLGLLASPYRGVRLGLVSQDLFDTRITYDGGATVVAFPRNVRAAASYAIGRTATVAVDVDDRYHLGVEATPYEGIALRAGMEDDRRGPEKATVAFGAGFKASVFRVDYAYVIHPTLAATNHFALSMGFNFNPAQIRIEKVETREIYGSLYRSYVGRPIGTAQVRNLRDTPLSARVQVFVPELMDAPSEQDVLLRPMAVQDVPLTAVLSERALSQPGDRTVQVQVSASYQSRRLTRTEKRSGRLVAYGPGAIDWSDGVEQAAAFVTARDPNVEVLAREASRTVALMTPDPFGNRNLSFAAAVFDALGELGVAYVPDPNNPFATISETHHAVDTIHYPHETLARRAGDCDDTSVLMAALMGNVGVNTQFVDVPGHLFLLVDTGLHERNRLGLPVADPLCVVDKGSVWIPLETTAIGKGFAEAWRSGAEAYAGWVARGQVQLVDVLAAQSRYEPAEPTSAAAAPAPSLAGLAERLGRDAQVVAGWREEYLAARFGGVRQAGEGTAAALNEIAHVYYLADRLDEARSRLQQILERDPGSALGHNNLAASWAAAGETERALEHLAAALASDRSDAGVWLNLGLVRYAAGDTTGVLEPFGEALALGGGYEATLGMLGLGTDEPASREGKERMTSEEVRRLLKTAVERVPVSSPAHPDTVGTARRPQPPRAIRTRVGAARSEPDAELKPLFYWKN